MLQTRFIHIVLITLSVVLEILCKNDTVVKIVLLKHLEGQNNIVEWYENAFTTLKTSMQYETIIVEVDDVDEDKNKICNALSQGGTVILDVSWHENDEAKDISTEMGVPYIRIDVSIGPMLSFLDSYLDFRNSTDVAIVFEDPTIIDQALHYWIDTTRLRLNMVESLDIVSARKLKEIRPIPKNYALIASTQNMTRMFSLVVQEKLVFLPDRWHLVFLDFRGKYFDRAFIGKKPINLLLPNSTFCCQLLMLEPLCICPENFNMQKQFLYIALETIVNILEEIARDELELTNNLVCNTTTYNEQTQKRFQDLLAASLSKDNNPISRDNSTLKPKLIGSIEVGGNGSRSIVATFEEPQITLLENKTIKPIKSFYRVGVTHALPWSYKVKDPVTDITTWAGYCIDFTAKLSQVMNFDYELVEPKTGTFGEKTNGRWDGVVGDLASGDTDLAITALIMTADREEIIDFVAPYFEQTGITILMRKPVRKTSLFKFMTVLKLEVWLSIVVALVVTGFMVWFLDKYSPYSARNNKKAYPYPCREFTLKESFWFALTSFTPQGGGEAPKALSGRTLVAAYWLFVVLMLATFTANLAAFLTVERMQAPVQSLEQLARQSRINYTVVKNSDSHLYFINMKFAEDTLYRMWKELTLNASTDDARYRVWDYPIKEQYGHILLAINDSDPVATAEEGFRNVNEHLDADYALIHDSSEIRYEISKNCNFTEVGEVFGEKPYAVAIQQGSHLQDDISRSILKLQKERFFESLQAKYWNHSAKGDCPSTDDNEGITLESLGGVFIATLFGLGLAMITLAGEVLYYRRKRKIILPKTENSKLQFPNNSRVPAISKSWQTQDYPLNFGTTFKPVNMKDKMSKEIEEMKLSHINLYPRARNRITQIQ